jgi:hypothetical protein
MQIDKNKPDLFWGGLAENVQERDGSRDFMKKIRRENLRELQEDNIVEKKE